MKKFILTFSLAAFATLNALSQDLKEVALTEEWLQKIEKLAPSKTNFPFQKRKKYWFFLFTLAFSIG